MKFKGSPIYRSGRYLYLSFIRLRGSAEEVARGMALGVFIGMTPTMGIQMPIALFFAMILRENKIAALIGVWISNPMTVIPIYTFNFKMGKYLLGTPDLKMPDFSSLEDIFQLGYDLLMPLTMGSLVVGVVAAAVAYVATLYIYSAVKYEKDKIKRKREEKAHITHEEEKRD
ncbi:MAG: DUF2062 domain-containing protein [Deltaproteobacteria bacterium]|nr:DUF2062 domain-containing protein [Deltaproteobacteria bacterium]